MDQDQLDDLLSTFVTDLGATITAGNVRIGDRLGLYRARFFRPGHTANVVDTWITAVHAARP